MSCYNCYSAPKASPSLVDKVLEQGQRLRNAMVQSILNNDPFNIDVVYSQREHPLKSSINLDNLSHEASEKIRAFLQGDEMSRQDEISALETLRSMSAAELCKVTDRTYSADKTCECSTCRSYKNEDLSCDLKRSGDVESSELPKVQEKRKSVLDYIKFVDSLKIFINEIVLNEAGNKKVFDNLADDKKAAVTQTYFLEYQVPEVLLKKQPKAKSRVNSGLDFNNTVRICARRSYQQEINFKHTSIHDVANLDKIKLDNIELRFKISCRGFKQKHPNLLGYAKLDLALLETTANFISNQELSIRLDENTPITVGTLKVSVQLGCGRLYFGKEFIDAVSTYKENSVAVDGEDWSKPPENPVSKVNTLKTKTETNPKVPPQEIENKQILFGFVYVSEAQFTREVLNSYLTCQTFGQDDVFYSKLVTLDSNPAYNFSQQLPLVYEDEFLLKLRENYMIVEFWEKGQTKDFVIGFTKLPLHCFYLAYRNPIIVKYLSERKLPIISTDGWEPIYNIVDEEVVGQALILLALGTKEQIDNLEAERGFKKNIVKAKFTPASHLKLKNNINNTKNKQTQSEIDCLNLKIKPPDTPKVDKPQLDRDLNKNKVKFSDVKKTIDVGIQSEMESKEPQDIGALLNQLIAQKPRNVHVENATNTDPVNPGQPDARKTSDLLDSLQKALSLDAPAEKATFKAKIVVNSAVHLPVRKKCKSKRPKSRGGKHEDGLPSTYVTFEGSNGDMKMTPVVPKSTCPTWDYHCDVVLPVEYLLNSQKRLIFKVWRKATNTTMTPNLQTDIVIGVAALDLTLLALGFPDIRGWFNIKDFSNKCQGQISINLFPLDDISRYQTPRGTNSARTDGNQTIEAAQPADEPSELLGRALKRKFTELDEITQRLRLRLSKVTNDESDASNDEIADQFERDINTLCVEDDFDTVDFEREARNFNINHMKEIGLLQTGPSADGVDEHLAAGKQRIDTLLEKLTLISAENSSRYVSGCSDSRIDAEAILSELDLGSRPNIHSGVSFDRAMSEKFSWETSDSCSDVSDGRVAPEGEGNSADVTKSTD